MPTDIEQVQDALRQAAAIPSFESAQILSARNADQVELLLNHSIRDFDRDRKRKISTFVSVDIGATGRRQEYSFEEKEEVIMSAAHEYVPGERVVFRSCEPDKGSQQKRLFVERWSRSSLVKSVEVTAVHGAFNADTTFGRISFDQQRHSRIAYVAEAKQPEDKTYTKFRYQDDWGEKLAESQSPVVVVLDFDGGLQQWQVSSSSAQNSASEGQPPPNADKVVIVKAPDNTACGDCTFGPEDNTIIYVATSTVPRRYGAFICPNRRSTIVRSDYPGTKHTFLTEDLEHFRSPNYIHDGRLLFLSNPSGGAHFQCTELRSLDPTATPSGSSVIVPRSNDTADYSHDFHGIYTDRIAYVYGDQVLITNPIRSRTSATLIKPTKNSTCLDFEVENLTPAREADTSSWSVLGAGKGQAVLARASPLGEVELRHFDLRTRRSSTIFQLLAPCPDLATTTIETYPDRPNLESIFHLPNSPADTFLAGSSKKLPLIVIPHGGPHTSTSTTYSTYHAALLRLGCALLKVNYTGSLGFSPSSIDDLVGHIGTTDVDDVQHAVKTLVDSGRVDPSRICVMGGSHGGFIAAWLLGKYADTYKAGILLNPVINLATVGAGSDIPDWACAEADIDYPLDKPPLPSQEMYSSLWEKSPMSVANKVRAPVMVALGGKDRRVPNYEGRNWVSWLRSRGRKAECYWYPVDGHGLEGGETFSKLFEAIGIFLIENL